MNEEYIARIHSKTLVSTEDGCHLWQGALDTGGYGIININKHQRRVHRLMWEYANGRPIPDGLMVRHQCGVRACVKPDHLLVGTAWDNAQDTLRHQKYQHGENHGTSKLTEEDVATAFRLRQEGRTIRQVAEAIGMSYSSMNALLNGRSWKSLTRPDNLPKRIVPQRIAPEAIEDARRMRDDEKRPWREIERVIGYDRAYLSEYLPRRTGFNPNPVILLPDEADEAVRLRARRLAGLSWKQIAEEMHLDRSTVSRAGMGLGWKSAGEPIDLPKMVKGRRGR